MKKGLTTEVGDAHFCESKKQNLGQRDGTLLKSSVTQDIFALLGKREVLNYLLWYENSFLLLKQKKVYEFALTTSLPLQCLILLC